MNRLGFAHIEWQLLAIVHKLPQNAVAILDHCFLESDSSVRERNLNEPIMK